jgi:hypothetical protein
VEHVLGPASVLVRGQLEDGAEVLSAARVRRAVEVSRLIKAQTSMWVLSVVAVRPRAEVMQDVLGPASVLVRGQLEDGAAVVATAVLGLP